MYEHISEAERQTDKQTKWKTDRHTDRKEDRQAYRRNGRLTGIKETKQKAETSHFCYLPSFRCCRCCRAPPGAATGSPR